MNTTDQKRRARSQQRVSAQCRVVLEGRIAGTGITELRTICDRLESELKGRALIIDLKDVMLISQEGENALLQLINHGAKFRPGGVLAKLILQQLASVEDITDEEIASTISYLDPNAGGEGTDDEANTFFIVCVSLMVLIVGVLAYLWLYLPVS